jgi:hypothetical protein
MSRELDTLNSEIKSIAGVFSCTIDPDVDLYDIFFDIDADINDMSLAIALLLHFNSDLRLIRVATTNSLLHQSYGLTGESIRFAT